MRLAPCTTLHLSTWRSQGWKFCLLSLVSACFGDHELLEGQGLASQDHCCFLHAHPPPKKKKKNTGQHRFWWSSHGVDAVHTRER